MTKRDYAANIPQNICDQLDRIQHSSKIRDDIYRVSKQGNIDDSTFDNTFSEILKGTIPGKNRDYQDVGTYSTSFYLSSEPCYDFISFLAQKHRDKYPKPCVIKGRLDEDKALFLKTSDRLKDSTSTHVDAWIFEGKQEEMVALFRFDEE